MRTTIVLASVFASVFAMPQVEAQIPGLIHCYPGDVDGSDTVGTNAGTFENGATAGTLGKVGGAFLFDGIDDGVNLGNVPDLDYSATSSFTWEAWVNYFGLTSQAVQYVLVTNYACTNAVQALWIYNSGANAGKAAFLVRDANDLVSIVSTPFALSSNTWHHLTAVRDVSPAGKFIRLYVDCALVASAPDITTAALASNASDFIGRRFLCPDRSTFNGLVDEVRFYNRALTHEEVAQAVAEAAGNEDQDGDGLLDSTEVEMSCPGACPSFSNPDSDGDTVSDGAEVAGGTNPCSSDTDGDGLLDSTEVDMAMGSGCPSPLDADSDNDGLTDGAEVAAGTNPCSSDTDGDGIPDGTDPLPLQPGVPCGFLESMMRSVAVEIDALPLSLFNGADANANSGRRNSLATRVQNAANSLCDGQGQSALANLNGVLEKVDGDEPPPDWMFDSPEKTALKESIERLISLTPP